MVFKALNEGYTDKHWKFMFIVEMCPIECNTSAAPSTAAKPSTRPSTPVESTSEPSIPGEHTTLYLTPGQSKTTFFS